MLIPQTLALVITAIIGGNIAQRTGRYKPLIMLKLTDARHRARANWDESVSERCTC